MCIVLINSYKLGNRLLFVDFVCDWYVDWMYVISLMFFIYCGVFFIYDVYYENQVVIVVMIVFVENVIIVIL